ncbi:MAG: tRNA 2-thiouridine(34) synthase MnmA [Nitrospirae bacterium]|nr:tRNA 2-thiouridine(34) synthase MnmA [Nitrospirota bacterium]
MNKGTVLVGMSGGVDSAVAAALLVEQGYRVIGATLRLWEGEEESAVEWHERSCCKIGLARYVAERLQIPYHVFDAHEAFERWVIEDFCNEYLAGRTPNPCVRCNEKIKFELLLQYASKVGADRIATGHYGRVERDDRGSFCLMTGIDSRKDQSYFLYRLNQSVLERTIFPLGGLHKEQVLEKARSLDLPVDEIRESQEVCFVTRKGSQDFLAERIPESLRPGHLVNADGTVVGTHPGIAFHTVGQRRGLGVSAPERQYVVKLDPERNEVVLGSSPELIQYDLTAGQVHWIGGTPQTRELRVSAKIRYRGEASEATLKRTGDERVQLIFDHPQRAVTPGQSVVFFDHERVLGGGIIES